MSSDGIVSTLAGQMLQAKARAGAARAQGKDARLIESIDRSLRRTLGYLAQIRDPREIAIQGFYLVRSWDGEIRVRHRERGLPVSSSYLQCLLGEAGVEPKPGQVIRLDDVLVAALVEEALGSLSQEEAGIRDRKSRLLKASSELGVKDLHGPSGPEGRPQEAA